MSSDVLEYLDAAVGFSYIQESAVGAACSSVCSSGCSSQFEQRASALGLGRVLSLALESGSLYLPKHIYCLVMASF